MATVLKLEAYGVELNQARAIDAKSQIQALTNRQDLPLCDHHPTRFIQGDYRTLVTSKGGYNLLYLNPPYDFDQDAGRLEYQWLRDCREWPGGAGYPARAAEDRPQAGLNEEQIASMVLCYNIFVYRIPESGVD
jgi:hypothetical protein